MKMRATLAAVALATSAFVLQPATAQAGHDHHNVRKHLHDAVHRVASVILCPLDWFRHRHHHAAYTPAPKKVVYAKKSAAKKVAYAKPLK